MQSGEEATATTDGLKAVLGQEEGMVFTEPLTFRFYIGKIIGIVFGNFLPVVLEMTADAVFSLQFQVKLFNLLKEGGVVLGSTV